MTNNNAQEISSHELLRMIENGEDFFVFDIRNKNESEELPLHGKKPIPSLNIPYFDIIEGGGKADYEESITHYIQSTLSTTLPKEKTIIVACAKGGASMIVTKSLNSLGYHAFNLSDGIESWSSLYDKKLIHKDSHLAIYQIIRVSRGCISYVIISDSHAAVIDPFWDIQYYEDIFIECNAQPQYIFDTHVHADHISGGKHLADMHHIPYYLHPYDGIFPTEMIPAKIEYSPSWADAIYPLGSSKIQALHIPGHTLGNQAFLLDNTYLFSGDSIFIHSISRPDLGGCVKIWTDLQYESIRKLLQLPESTVVLPGHYSSYSESDENHRFCRTLKELKNSNIGLKMAEKSLDEFRAFNSHKFCHPPSQYKDIKKINLGLLCPNEDVIKDLDYGINHCALSTTHNHTEHVT